MGRGTRVACLAEAAVSEYGKVSVPKLTIAVDPGIAIDPGSIHSQTEGGAIWGLSNLPFNKIDVVGGGTAQGNLDTTPGAVGEPGSFIVYGVVGNAASRASGVKQYSYPFRTVDLIPSPNP